jgi:carbamoyl-phosphate synthase small subunit
VGLRVLGFRGLRCRTGLRARLLLEAGYGVEGCGFGAPGVRVGELVFTTAMTGYPESLTDPSYAGQILVVAHPMVGNYGVPRPLVEGGLALNMESERVQVEALVVAEYPEHSHPKASMSLGEWLEASGVPGIYAVDTRWLVRLVRSMGVMHAAAAVYPEDSRPPD